MPRGTRKLVTIVTEAAAERGLIEDLRALGASGWTILEARGAGERGERPGDWTESRNVRIETLCDADTAGKLLDHLRVHWYAHFAMVAWAVDVEVVRPEKFGPGGEGDRRG